MANTWVNHVMQYAAANKLSYGCALSMSECKSSYKSTKTKPKESEIKDTKVYTMYKKPIGPVKPKPETKPYTKYDRYVYTYICVYACKHRCMHTCIYAYKNTCIIHTRTRTHAHARTHTHTHTHIPAPPRETRGAVAVARIWDR